MGYQQILSMVGLVIAVTRGAVDESYIDWALGSDSGIEVPLAPAGNLVLAKCFFRDGAVLAPVKTNCTDATAALDSIRAAVVDEIAGSCLRQEFCNFVSELDEV